MSNKKEELLVSCAAGDHTLGLYLDADEHLVYLAIGVGAFYAKQSSFSGRWWDRLCMITTILRGNEYLFEDIVLGRDEAARVADFLLNLED